MVNRRSNGTQVRPYIRSSKPRFNWSDELKKLFDEAVRDLGCPRKATPKRIRELMRCSEIQLSHIKSRLQNPHGGGEENSSNSILANQISEENKTDADSNSAQELQSTRKRESIDNVDNNGDEHGIVVDGNEYDQIYPLKRLKIEARSPSIQGRSGAAASQFYFDYFDTAQLKWRAVTEFSCDELFRDEQLDAFKENTPQEGHNKESTKNDNLQLSLSLSLPSDRAKKINLDLSMAIAGS